MSQVGGKAFDFKLTMNKHNNPNHQHYQLAKKIYKDFDMYRQQGRQY